MLAALLASATVCYAVSGLIYLRWVLRPAPAASDAGNAALAVATLLFGAAGVYEITIGPAALGLGARVVLFVTFGASVVLLGGRLWRDIPMAGPVLAPLAAVVGVGVLTKSLGGGPQLSGTVAMGAVTAIHIGATMLGFLLFVPAYVLAVLFLDHEYRLKTKQLTGGPGMPLLTLERNAWRLLYFGFPLLTLGIVLGVVWQERAAGASLQPQHVMAVIGWGVFAYAIARRLKTGWRGRRAALTLMGAFVATFGAVLLYMMR